MYGNRLARPPDLPYQFLNPQLLPEHDLPLEPKALPRLKASPRVGKERGENYLLRRPREASEQASEHSFAEGNLVT